MENLKTKLSDEVLVQMYKEGDSLAFDIIFKRHVRTIAGLIYTIVKDSILSEDLTQDVFIKAMRHIKNGRYVEQGAFKSWLLHIAHNVGIDSIRRDKKMPSTFFLATSGDFEEGNHKSYYPIMDLEGSPEEKLIDKENKWDIHSLIDDLPCEQKEVVLLRIFHDFSFDEIARYTDVSINTALGRMRYALINLRKQLDIIRDQGGKVL